VASLSVASANNSEAAEAQLAVIHFVGLIMGLAVRTRAYLSLDLSRTFWEQLVNIASRESLALEWTDEGAAQSLRRIAVSDPQRAAQLGKIWFARNDPAALELVLNDLVEPTFIARRLDGVLEELLPGGATRTVTPVNAADYVHRWVMFRLSELNASSAFAALRRGLEVSAPGCWAVLASLFAPVDVERIMCGKCTIDIELLQRCTTYELGLGPTAPQVLLLWKVLRGFTNAQRALFLRFVWGRSRLPASASDFERPFTVTPLGGRCDIDPDSLLPQAHTCFFRLILPPWRTRKAARERLLFAISNCSAMDTDFDASAPDVSTRSAWRGV
jgi:E3 ubiquitin-protein ligase HERC2